MYMVLRAKAFLSILTMPRNLQNAFSQYHIKYIVRVCSVYLMESSIYISNDLIEGT